MVTTQESKPKRSGLKVTIAFVLLSVALAGGAMYAANSVATEVSAKSGVEPAFSQLKGDIATQQGISDELSQQIKQTGKSLSGTFMSKDEFIAFIGANSQRLGLKLSKYTGGETVTQDGIDTTKFILEVEGSLEQLEDLVKSVDALNVPYAINSISTRKADTYIWLDRDTDKQEILSWYDGSSLVTQRTYTEVEEEEPIGIQDIMGNQALKMYLDISFIVSDENLEDEALGKDSGDDNVITSEDGTVISTPEETPSFDFSGSSSDSASLPLESGSSDNESTSSLTGDSSSSSNSFSSSSASISISSVNSSQLG